MDRNGALHAVDGKFACKVNDESHMTLMPRATAGPRVIDWGGGARIYKEYSLAGGSSAEAIIEVEVDKIADEYVVIRSKMVAIDDKIDEKHTVTEEQGGFTTRAEAERMVTSLVHRVDLMNHELELDSFASDSLGERNADEAIDLVRPLLEGYFLRRSHDN